MGSIGLLAVFTFYNIVPYNPGAEEQVARDMSEYVERTGNEICLYSLNLQVDGKPAWTKVERALESYRRLKAATAGTPVKLGVLLQATMGHWARVSAEIEPWQRTIDIKGNAVRFCPLDKNFRKYIFNTVSALAREDPVMIMGDDDIRCFSPHMECFCPLHIAEFNRRNNCHYTSEQLREIMTKGHFGEKDYDAFIVLQRETIEGFGALIREAIDSVNPAIPAAACMPGWNLEMAWSSRIATAMAAKGQEPILRVNNSLYCEGAPWDDTCRIVKTLAYRAYHKNVRNLLDEADTCPHNLWSKSAVTMHEKLVTSIFAGYTGTKIWYINGRKGTQPVHRNYTDILAAHRGYYDALMKAVGETRRMTGIIQPAHPDFPRRSPNLFEMGGLTDKVFTRIGLPIRVETDFSLDNGIWVLSGEELIANLADDDLEQIFSHRVVVDMPAAQALTKRGFASYMGVTATPDKTLGFNIEHVPESDLTMWTSAMYRPACRFELADGAESFASLAYRPYAEAKITPVTPSAVLYRNRLGGHVVTLQYHPGLYWMQILTEARKKFLFKVFEKLGGLDYAVTDNNQTLVLARKGCGRDLVVVCNNAYDPVSGVTLRSAAPVYGIEKLSNSGVWEKIAYTRKSSGDYCIADTLACCAVSVYRLSVGEAPYAFRERLENVHQSGRRDASVAPTANEFVFKDGMGVGDEDFADYLNVSMGVKATTKCDDAMKTYIDTALSDREYEIEVTAKGVHIRAVDARALHQAYYHLEDLMNLRRAPYLTQGKEKRRMRFSPRMTHSGWGVDMFPEAHLRQMAHHGFDAILIFLTDADQTQGLGDHAGVNETIERAAKCGLDTYLYSKVSGFAHPDDPDGAAKLRASFGRVAAAHPKAKGIVFVGESCEFPSRDPRTCGLSYKDKRPEGEKRPLPGWFPCSDYPDWLNAVKKALYEHAPGMEIVFWTYNWSRQPENLCADLVGKFPDGVAIQGTFGKGESVTHRNGLENSCRDYTISAIGPTRHFAAEAQAARAADRRLYAMVNTAGLTWDYGVVPYEPCPYQWKRRWDGLVRAQADWGLAGLMESHHFGWYPSFVSELVKEAYTEGGLPFEQHVRQIAARDFGEANVERVVAVWKRWSDAADDYVATNENQYGPFRIGPAFPYNLGGEEISYSDFPQSPTATHVMRWMAYLNYPYDQKAADTLNIVFRGVSDADHAKEAELFASMRKAYSEGAAELRQIAETLDPVRRTAALSMARVGEWLQRTVETANNVKRGYEAHRVGDKAGVLKYARAEYANARAALKLAEADSRLGWEPSMEYAAGPEQLRWKLGLMEKLYGKTALTAEGEK